MRVIVRGVVALLSVQVALGGCGTFSRGANSASRLHCTAERVEAHLCGTFSRRVNASRVAAGGSLPNVGRFRAPEDVKGIPVLATGRLPGDGRFAFYAEPHRVHGTGRLYYILMNATAEPAADEPQPVPLSHVVDGMVWGHGGGAALEAYYYGVQQISIIYECVGSYPFALAYGRMRNARNTITASSDGRTVRFKKAVIPARLHPDGVLVYALLPPGRNDVVTRTLGGRVVSTEHWSGQGAYPVRGCGW
ncbi:MAG: hypothetical protein ACYCUM_03600 [Solirubrobacteraceae bacterium]